MNPEIFAEWFRRQGHQVYKSKSSYWVDQGPSALQAFPYHWIIEPSDEEIERLIRDTNSITLRFSTPIGSREGHISYHAILFDKSYEIEKLGKWARKNIRRGLANCCVEEISFDRLAKEGYDLQVDTLDRQGRGVHISRQEWETRCLSAKDLPGFTAWGALVDGKLAASVITFIMDDCAYMLYQQCHRKYLDLHVNNALGYSVTVELMSKSVITSILYGLHSLDAPSSVDEFKFRMGYEALPVRQRVCFSPIIRPFINSYSHNILMAIRKVSSSNPFIAKTEGMVRFYCEGKRPLENQEWPEIFGDQKEKIIQTLAHSS